MMSPSQALVLDPVFLWLGWRAARVQWDMRGSSVSAAPLGTAERPRASGPTAPVCPARATGTARRVTPRRVRGAEQTGNSKKGGSPFVGWTTKQNSSPSPFQACATAGITQRGLTVRSALMVFMVMPLLAQPRTASPARAQAPRAVPLCPAPRRLCAPAVRLALQVCSYTKHLLLHPRDCGNVSPDSCCSQIHSE